MTVSSAALQLEQSDVSMNPIEEGDAESFSDEGIGGSSGREHLSSSEGPPEIASKETRLVNYSKVLVVVVILVMATIIGLITYQYVSDQEDSNYKKQFDNVARDIIASSKVRGRNIFDNLESVSVTLTSYALATNAEWPFFMFPNFQVLGMVSNSITGATTLSINPIVLDEKREAYERFAVENAMEWMAEGHMYDDEVHPDLYVETRYYNEPTEEVSFPVPPWNVTGITPYLYGLDLTGYFPVRRETAPYYIPYGQVAPAADFAPLTNLDTNFNPNGSFFNEGVIRYKKPVLSSAINADYLDISYDKRFRRQDRNGPHSYIFYPVFDTLKKDRTVVAMLDAFLRWDQFFYNVLPEGEKPISLVLVNSCTQTISENMPPREVLRKTYTYELRGEEVIFISEGDLHDSRYDSLEKFSKFAERAKLESIDGYTCDFEMKMYPTEEWSQEFFTNTPYYYAAAVIACFLMTTMVFIVYDCLVQKRNRTVMESATKTNQIVSSLFPSNVRDRLLEELKPAGEEKKPTAWSKSSEIAKSWTEVPLNDDDSSRRSCITSDRIFGSQPIADLFPNTTILFADMVGFTAWSSVREPTQVFMLLETVYHAFDLIAKKRRVFKVETIGDCYVACAGLPVPRKDHALVMARFADDCLNKMNKISHELESIFGPDTADLCMRCGLHSGPVTAGVLRGEKGRFQLFGDTMNTASRMESTGVPRKVQISQETADLLVSAGKSKWVTARDDKVFCKGKGELQTFFLGIKTESHGSLSETLSTSASLKDDEYDLEAYTTQASYQTNRMRLLAAITPAEDVSVKNQRLITWNADVLGKFLRHVVARRATRKKFFAMGREQAQRLTPSSVPKEKPLNIEGGNLLDEVVDVLALPHFDEKLFMNHVDPDTVDLSPNVVSQLTAFVTKIAALYNNTTPFHNFEHASHVTLSVTKLLGRIVNPIDVSRQKGPDHKFASALHDHTFGITTDPLTQFAAVFSALIHDLDHPGVPNAVLVTENDPMATKYNGKSVAEQNSVDLSWSILMQPEFEDLRGCIYTNNDELGRFRSLVVNLVLATDIMDKQLGALRRDRWVKAFSNESSFNGDKDSLGSGSSHTASSGPSHTHVNRKATIVLEHLIQASDIAHTMQHWHVFRKWNERLFCEMYQMYLDGRSEKDPSEGWYQGEIGFFDFYIIPLAKKLETCGVFGVSSSEYLGYAEANREEWVKKGEQLVKVYLERFKLRKSQEDTGATQSDIMDLVLPPESAPLDVSLVGLSVDTDEFGNTVFDL